VCLSISPFVPKPHTPFQWERQDRLDQTRDKLRWIRKRLAGSGIEVKHHDLEATAVEGIISRGGRETADVIEGAWRRGARFDEWTEQLQPGAWMAALGDVGTSLDARFSERDESEALPWEVVSYGIRRRWFQRERRRAYAETLTEECRRGRCSACGVCDFETVKNVLAAQNEGVGNRGLEAGEPRACSADGPPSPEGRSRNTHQTIRLRYTKQPQVRFLSHLDVLRELLRCCRRARAPLVFSGGFVPRPRLSAGQALATGWTSASEWLDLELWGEWDEGRLEELLEVLNRQATPGLRFLAAGTLRPSPSLSAAVERSAYRATFPQPPFEPAFATLDAGCRAFLARDAVPFVRQRSANRTRMVDLRPLVYDLAALDGSTVALDLRTASDGSAKPTEILEAACGVPKHLLPLINIHKTGTWLTGGVAPLAGCTVTAGETSVETGDTDQWEPAGDPRGDPGGRHPR
jgi:radical SAM-linked protein